MAELLLTAFADEISPQLDVQMDVLERHGIFHIELRNADGVNISDMSVKMAHEIQSRMDARGFSVSALGSPIGKVDIREPYDAHWEKFCHTVTLAEVLACPYIRMFSFFMPPGEDPAAYRDEVLRRLDDMARYAQCAGVTLMHENEKQIYGDTAERCLDIFTQVDSPNLRMTYDPSNFVQCGEDNARAWPLLKQYVRYIHIKDSLYSQEAAAADAGHDTDVVSDAHRPAGEGDGQVVAILRDLHRSNYHGFVSIEPHLDNCALITGNGADRFSVALYGFRRSWAQAQG